MNNLDRISTNGDRHKVDVQNVNFIQLISSRVVGVLHISVDEIKKKTAHALLAFIVHIR